MKKLVIKTPQNILKKKKELFKMTYIMRTYGVTLNRVE